MRVRSSATRSTARFRTATRSSSWCCASAASCVSLCQTFSNPSKQRKAPPIMSRGAIIAGATALIRRAAGTRITLLSRDPFATAQTTGSSRSGVKPITCSALRAKSSPTTPLVFLTATLDMVATSSSSEVMSSRRARRPAPAMRGRYHLPPQRSAHHIRREGESPARRLPPQDPGRILQAVCVTHAPATQAP